MWQLIDESEQVFASRLNSKSNLSGNIHEELEKMTLSVDEFEPTALSIVEIFPENDHRQDLKFKINVQYDQDQGDEYRSQRVGTRNSKLPTRGSKKNALRTLLGTAS